MGEAVGSANATASCPFLPVGKPTTVAVNTNCEYGDTTCFVTGKYHSGIDFTGNGTAVASARGVVERVEFMNPNDHGMGTNVILRHVLADCSTIFTTYSHLASVDSGIAQGNTVVRGQRIGVLGGSGNNSPTAWGTHLHFELKRSAVTGNPVGVAGTSCPSTNSCWGYLPSHPDGFGYTNPSVFVDRLRVVDFWRRADPLVAKPFASPCDPNFDAQFKIQNLTGSSVTIDQLAIAVHNSGGQFLFDLYSGSTGSPNYLQGIVLSSGQTLQFPISYGNIGSAGSYQVVAKARFGSYWHNLATLTFSVQPPVVPTYPSGVAATDGTLSSGVRVTWGASSGASRYEVWRNTSANACGALRVQASVATTSYEDTSAVPGTTYYYWVKACNASGCSGFSLYNTGYRGSASVPSPPAGVSASDGTYSDRIRVTWGAVSGATSYEVWRNTSSSTTTAVRRVVQSTTTYDDTSVSAGTTYYFWVKACNASGCSGFSAYNTGYRRSLSVPSAPTGVAASDGTYSDRIRVTWGAVSGATSYEVWRNTSSSTSTAVRRVVQSSTTYDDTSVSAGTAYYYWVKACNASGCSGFSAYNTGYRRSSSVPSAPTGVSASDGTYSDRIRVTWGAVSGATSYEVWRNTSSSTSTAVRRIVQSATIYDDTGVTVGTTYYPRLFTLETGRPTE